jgi:hypothetical protein
MPASQPYATNPRTVSRVPYLGTVGSATLSNGFTGRVGSHDTFCCTPLTTFTCGSPNAASATESLMSSPRRQLCARLPLQQL